MAVKKFLLGKHLTAITVAGGTETGGTITWTTAVSLAGIGDYVRVSDDRMLDMITAVDATFAHYEKTLNDSSLSVGEILRNGTRSVLEELSATYDFVKVVFTRGGTTWTYKGRIATYGDGVASQGKNTGEMSLKPIDDGGAPLLSAFS